MFDTILNRLFPAAMVGGVAVYALVTLIWLQPLVERRMAEKYLIPACEAGLQHSEGNTPVPVNPRRHELEMLIQMLEGMDLDKIPAIRMQLDEARRQLRAMRESRRPFSGIERNTTCGCAVNKAYETIRFPQMLIHVASGRTYNPTNVQRAALEQSTLQFALSGQCGDLPWK